MPIGAPALAGGMRLRARRERADRGRGSTIRLALVASLAAALIGFVGAANRDDRPLWLSQLTPERLIGAPLPAPPPPLTREEQQFSTGLRAIHTDVEHTLAGVGLGAAVYKTQEIDRAELRVRLTHGLAGFQLAEARIAALDPPPSLRAPRDDYLSAVRLFQASTVEMLRMYEDGDEAHLAAALPLSLAGTTRLQEVGGQFWPDAYAVN